MSKIVDQIWNRYINLSDSEEEFTVKDDINKRKEEENNYDHIVLYPYCCKCNKFHKKETKCKLKGTVSV